MQRTLRSTLGLVAAAALGASLAMVPTSVLNPNASTNGGDTTSSLRGRPATAGSIYTDEIFDYGVCRGTDPTCYNDWGRGWQEGEEKRILIWSRTPGPRHAHLGTPLAEGLNPPLADNNVAQAQLVAWAAERGIQADYTEDLSQFRLNDYQAVVFLSANRDTLDDTAQTSLRQYIRGGGGFVGIHNAFGAEYSWPYYEGLLGGANFFDHGRNREGTVIRMDKKDSSTSALPDSFQFTDEFYSLEPYPSYVRPLLRVDAATSADGRAHPGHGDEHLVSWCHYYDGGRSFLTTLGHDPAMWTDTPIGGDVEFEEHVMGGIESAMGVAPFCT